MLFFLGGMFVICCLILLTTVWAERRKDYSDVDALAEKAILRSKKRKRYVKYSGIGCMVIKNQ